MINAHLASGASFSWRFLALVDFAMHAVLALFPLHGASSTATARFLKQVCAALGYNQPASWHQSQNCVVLQY